MHPTLPAAREAFLAAPFGNPSSEHHIGQVAVIALENARYTIAKCLDCEPECVFFTSTATEAAATVMKSLSEAGIAVEASPFEHHAVSENATMPWDDAQKPCYYARMYANNETGEIFTLPPSARYAGWICDATAAVGHIPVSFWQIGCDYLIFDAIKFGGYPGAAALIAKKGAPLTPLIRGGGQERGMRSGTENVPAICAMAAALEWQTEHMEANIEKLNALKMSLFERISSIPDHQLNTRLLSPCLPHILNVSFDGVDGHALALLLSQEGVMVSAGAACSSGKNEPSHVLVAMYHDEARARSAIRISLSHDNMPDEIAVAGTKIAECVKYLRDLG